MELFSRISQIVSGRSGLSGRPVRLTIREQVVATLIVVRHNVNQATIADMFGVPHAMISRVYRRVVPLIEQAYCLSGVALDTAIQGRVVLLVDGTDVPAVNGSVAGRENYFGKRYGQGSKRVDCVRSEWPPALRIRFRPRRSARSSSHNVMWLGAHS
ncbi:transposase family protein [Rathayibacter toxicus]|uniref:transposase family protein n=1 Tax=Rathayibacter toxicus TaxID=145458 RepID=UPI000AC1B308|nr:transposase family protein [Rathayibacter toxicus]